MLNNWKIAHKLTLVIAVSVLGLSLVIGLVLNNLHRVMLEDRHSQIQQLVGVVHGLLGHYAAQARKGDITAQAAQRAARLAIAGLRYADGQYFWLMDETDRKSTRLNSSHYS